MILPDANLLLYTVNTDAREHASAFKWWRDLLHSGAEVGIYTGVAFAFIRLSTNRRVFSHPLSVNDAFAYLNNWLSFPAVKWVNDTVEDYRTVETLIKSAGTASNLVSDAQIAAVALRLHATVHSCDTDFDRFPKLNWKNPLN